MLHKAKKRGENGKKEEVSVQGRRVPITESEFQSLCDVPDEGTFMAQCELWQKWKRGWSVFRMEDLFDEMSEAKMPRKGDTRAIAPREFGGCCNMCKAR